MNPKKQRKISNVPEIPANVRVPEMEWARMWLCTEPELTYIEKVGVELVNQAIVNDNVDSYEVESRLRAVHAMMSLRGM